MLEGKNCQLLKCEFVKTVIISCLLPHLLKGVININSLCKYNFQDLRKVQNVILRYMECSEVSRRFFVSRFATLARDSFSLKCVSPDFIFRLRRKRLYYQGEVICIKAHNFLTILKNITGYRFRDWLLSKTYSNLPTSFGSGDSMFSFCFNLGSRLLPIHRRFPP